MTDNLLMKFIQDVNLDSPETMNQVADEGFHMSPLFIILILMVIMLIIMNIRRRRQG